jgi:hypothetical protein
MQSQHFITFTSGKLQDFWSSGFGFRQGLRQRSVSREALGPRMIKPWSGPVNFALWLANTILSKNSRTWQLIITIQNKFMIVVYEYILQNNISKEEVFSFPDGMIYFRLGRLQNSKAVSTWALIFPDKTRNVYYCAVASLYSIYNVVQMSDEILRFLHCSNTLIYNILYGQNTNKTNN